MSSIKKFFRSTGGNGVLIPKYIIDILEIDVEDSIFYILLDETKCNFILRHKTFSKEEHLIERKMFQNGNSNIVTIPPDALKIIGINPRDARFKILLEGKDILIKFI